MDNQTVSPVAAKTPSIVHGVFFPKVTKNTAAFHVEEGPRTIRAVGPGSYAIHAVEGYPGDPAPLVHRTIPSGMTLVFTRIREGDVWTYPTWKVETRPSTPEEEREWASFDAQRRSDQLVLWVRGRRGEFAITRGGRLRAWPSRGATLNVDPREGSATALAAVRAVGLGAYVEDVLDVLREARAGACQRPQVTRPN